MALAIGAGAGQSRCQSRRLFRLAISSTATATPTATPTSTLSAQVACEQQQRQQQQQRWQLSLLLAGGFDFISLSPSLSHLSLSPSLIFVCCVYAALCISRRRRQYVERPLSYRHLSSTIDLILARRINFKRFLLVLFRVPPARMPMH